MSLPQRLRVRAPTAFVPVAGDAQVDLASTCSWRVRACQVRAAVKSALLSSPRCCQVRALCQNCVKTCPCPQVTPSLNCGNTPKHSGGGGSRAPVQCENPQVESACRTAPRRPSDGSVQHPAGGVSIVRPVSVSRRRSQRFPHTDAAFGASMTLCSNDICCEWLVNRCLRSA